MKDRVPAASATHRSRGMTDMDYEKLRDSRNSTNPYAKRMGIFVEEIGPGCARAVMDVTPDDANPVGVPHGGCYFSLADTASGWVNPEKIMKIWKPKMARLSSMPGATVMSMSKQANRPPFRVKQPLSRGNQYFPAT